MRFADFLPVRSTQSVETNSDEMVDETVVDSRNRPLARQFKSNALGLGFAGRTFTGRKNFESSPYDFNRVLKAVDTDSFVKQAFNKYKELIWKGGWDITSENYETVLYVYERIDFMEFAMSRTFEDLLIEIGDQLIKFGNAFVAKARGDLNSFFPGKLQGRDGKDPIVGYYVIPAETVQILRNKNNKPLQYRQSFDDIDSNLTARRQPTWDASEVIHFAMDKKPGRAFGTPFMVAVMEDIIALRQMEEDVQNLVHKELFPLYTYSVGSEQYPAEKDEIDNAVNELENLRTDGGLVLPERHEVNVVGTDSNALDASDYIKYFLNRVCTGLGLAPHHLGLMMDQSGNRAITDRLDIALYDKVKHYQRYMSGMIRLHMLTELLLEAGYNPVANPLAEGVSDRCVFRFNEIDTDTQTKLEEHILQKFAMNAIELSEVRRELGYDPEDVEINDLLMGLTNKFSIQQNEAAAKAQAAARPPAAGGSSNTPSKPNAQKPSTGGSPNPPNLSRSNGNKVRPANQHGRRSSPNIRHSIGVDETLLSEMEELLEEKEE